MSFKVIIDYYKNFSCEQIQALKAECVVVHLSGYSCYAGERFKLEDIDKITDLVHSAGKLVALGFDIIIEENRLEETLKILTSIIDKFDYIVYSDLAVYKFLKDNNKNIKFIYDSKTYIASKFENNYWRNKNVIPIIANELNEAEITAIAENGTIAIEIFGYHRIMYSKRKLLNMYQMYLNDSSQFIQNKLYFAKEELRNEMCPIIETEVGTMIFTPYIYNAIELLKNKNFVDNIDFVKISCDFLNDEIIEIALKTIELAKNNLDINENLNILYDFGSSRGFLDRQSFLVKGGKNA